MLDANKLGLVQGVDISFLNEQEQQWVLDAMFDMNIFPNTQQSARLKAFSRENTLDQNGVRDILMPDLAANKSRKVTFKADKLDEYFDEKYTEEMITDIIVDLLNEWKKRG